MPIRPLGLPDTTKIPRGESPVNRKNPRSISTTRTERPNTLLKLLCRQTMEVRPLIHRFLVPRVVFVVHGLPELGVIREFVDFRLRGSCIRGQQSFALAT